MLSAEQIQSNWDKFLLQIKERIHGERGTILLSFFNEFDERFAMMPASGKTSYHNAFPGGYIDHVLRVLELSHVFHTVWKDSGVDVPSIQEVSFVALLHDLGKFGDFDNEEYLPQDQDWARKRGEEYKHNPDINFMKTSERSLYILQALGVQISQDEYLGIKLHDGLYEEANKAYYIAYADEYRLRSNIAYIVHQADLLATRIEHDNFMNKDQKKADDDRARRLSISTSPKTNTVKLPDALNSMKPPKPAISVKKETPPPAPKAKVQGGKYAAFLNKL